MLLNLHHDLFTIQPAGASIAANYMITSRNATLNGVEGPILPRYRNSFSSRMKNPAIRLPDGREVCGCLSKKAMEAILSKYPEDIGLRSAS